MAVTQTGKVPFQPYARLISILGDQLISDKWVGVIELVKNCYDADAENVFVRFKNFDDPSKESFIEIEDDGHGMDLGIIKDVWMKPATPNKLNRKKTADRLFTKKGRVMQGDKGVGRFAIYKLGDLVEVYTKTAGSDEIKLTMDFQEYADDEFRQSDHKDKFLEDIESEFEVHSKPNKIVKGHGTLIRISKPRNDWKVQDLNKLAKAFFRMMPPSLPGVTIKKDFEVFLFWNSRRFTGEFLTFEKMADLAPYYFEGSISEGVLDANYVHHNKTIEIKFNLFEDENLIINHDIRKLPLFKERFLTYEENKKQLKEIRKPQIGDFIFFFYGYDLKNPVENLKKVEKDFLKETSVYLYRDNVRVYPYGEIGDDWLMLSKYRAEDRAGSYFSYNDLIGFIFITQKENPKLRDAADREGLMNINGAKEDFVALIQAALKVMKDRVEIDKTKEQIRKQKATKSLNKEYNQTFENLQKKLLKINDEAVIKDSKKFFEATNKIIKKFQEELKISQELAGTGMAVEKATHDTMSLLLHLNKNTEALLKSITKDEIDKVELEIFLKDLKENLEFLYQELQVLQPLFRVSRKITRNVSVSDVLNRVLRYFAKELEGKIIVEVNIIKDIVVKTNTGLVLQVILNLMDNSIYWLEQVSETEKRIKVVVDGDEGTLLFADSGPGIEKDISEIIFTEFFSRKAEGRGLGLYIVKELLYRIEADIRVVTNTQRKILSGANLLVEFKKFTS